MKYGIFVVLLFSILACKKAEDRRCIKGAGNEVAIERQLDVFSKVFIGPNVHIMFVQDSLNKVVITGGENLVNHIGSEIIDGQLRIENNNRCNFLRSYKHQVNVEIHFTDLTEIYFEGTKPVNCEGQLILNNLIVIIRDGAGEMNLNVDCNNLDLVVTNGWGNFDVDGVTNNLRLDIRNNGFGNTYDLAVSNELNIISNTAGKLEVFADNAILNAQTSSSGDIYYKGIPSNIDYTSLGTGELLDNN